MHFILLSVFVGGCIYLFLFSYFLSVALEISAKGRYFVLCPHVMIFINYQSRNTALTSARPLPLLFHNDL
jgi:hypothetical protein